METNSATMDMDMDMIDMDMFTVLDTDIDLGVYLGTDAYTDTPGNKSSAITPSVEVILSRTICAKLSAILPTSPLMKEPDSVAKRTSTFQDTKWRGMRSTPWSRC